MNFFEYQKRAHATAVYGGNIAYPISALAEEFGEVLELWCEWSAKAETLTISWEDQKKKFLDELGDVLWDASELVTVLGGELDVFMPLSTECKPNIPSVTYYIAQLGTAISKVSGRWAKFIRKHNGQCPDLNGQSEDEIKFRYDFCQDVMRVLHKWCELVQKLGLDYDEILEHNIAKLAARKAANTLGGEGSVERK